MIDIKIYRIMGKTENCKIPYPIRLALGLHAGTLLSFEDIDERTVLVKKENICDDCKKSEGSKDNTVIFFNGRMKPEAVYENSLVSD